MSDPSDELDPPFDLLEPADYAGPVLSFSPKYIRTLLCIGFDF